MSKIAVVIGGCRGIGRAISLKLSNQGFTTYATSRNPVEMEQVTSVQLDLTDEKSVKNLFEKMKRDHGKIDVLVNNAGVSIPKPFEEVEPKEWELVFKTNVFGPFLCTQQAFPLMKQNGGRIINITSILTKSALPQNTIYTASKLTLQGWGDVLTGEWYKYQIYSTNLVLGATYTDIWKGVEDVSPEDMLEVNDVAQAAAFIATSPLHVRIDEIMLTPPKGII